MSEGIVRVSAYFAERCGVGLAGLALSAACFFEAFSASLRATVVGEGGDGA